MFPGLRATSRRILLRPRPHLHPVSTRPSRRPASGPTLLRRLSPRGTDEGASAPRTGRALFAWTKDQDGKFEYGLLKHLNAWAKSQEFPARMVDWDAEQVSRAYAEARRRLRALQATRHGRRSRAVELSPRREHDQG